MSPVELGPYRSDDRGNSSRSWEDFERNARGYIRTVAGLDSIVQVEYSYAGRYDLESLQTANDEAAERTVSHREAAARTIEAVLEQLD